MAEKQQNLQDAFLNKIRKEKMTVTVFLMNGVKAVIQFWLKYQLNFNSFLFSTLAIKRSVNTSKLFDVCQFYDNDRHNYYM